MYEKIIHRSRESSQQSYVLFRKVWGDIHIRCGIDGWKNVYGDKKIDVLLSNYELQKIENKSRFTNIDIPQN